MFIDQTINLGDAKLYTVEPQTPLGKLNNYVLYMEVSLFKGFSKILK